MRLDVVSSGHTFGTRMKLAAIRLFLGRPAPDVVKTILYRSELFGDPFSRILQEALRGESVWSVGERELFAAFTSRLNQCPF